MCYISSQEESTRRLPYFVQLAAVRAARRAAALARRAQRDAEEAARPYDPELEAVLAALDALGSPAPANDLAPAPALSTLSKKSKIQVARPRRSGARDKRNLHRIKGFERDIRIARRQANQPPLVSAPPSPLSTTPTPSTHPTTPATSKRQKATEADTRKAPAWRYTTDIARGHCAIRSVSTRGAGLSWSLNLGGKVLDAANDNAAQFMRQFQDRLAKAVLAEFGETRDFLFGIECTTAGRPHLHGAIDAVENEKARVETILVRCGGPWASSRHREMQADVRDLYAPDGWLRYIEKDMARTKAALGLKSILSMTRGCRARAEATWERSRHAAH